MSEPQRLDRKNFLKLTLSFAGASASAWLVGCGGEDPPEGTAGTGGGSAGSGVGGKGGGAGSGGTGTGGSTAGTGTAGTTAGSGGKGGTGGSAGSGVGGAGGSTGGSAGASPGGSSGAGGTSGSASGGAAGSGGSVGGAGSGGTAGSSPGGAAGSGGKSGGSCGMPSVEQNDPCMQDDCSPHTHVPTGQALMTYLDELVAHITGPDALMPFRTAMDGAQSPSGLHGHLITFTQAEIDTLLSGGTINNKIKDPDDYDDFHEWTISCG